MNTCVGINRVLKNVIMGFFGPANASSSKTCYLLLEHSTTLPNLPGSAYRCLVRVWRQIWTCLRQIPPPRNHCLTALWTMQRRTISAWGNFIRRKSQIAIGGPTDHSGGELTTENSKKARRLGVHISKVRSVELDQWSLPMLGIMGKLGNGVANHVLEARIGGGEKPGRGCGRGANPNATTAFTRTLQKTNQ